MSSARVQEALEHFAENESLLADLTDRSATMMLAWIARQVEAADAAADDAAFDRQTTAIRRAVRQAIAATDDPAGEAPAAIVARAEAILRATGDPTLIAAPQSAVESPPAAGVVDQTPPPTLGADEAAPATPPPSADPTALLRRAPIPRPAVPAAPPESVAGDDAAADVTHRSTSAERPLSPQTPTPSAMHRGAEPADAASSEPPHASLAEAPTPSGVTHGAGVVGAESHAPDHQVAETRHESATTGKAHDAAPHRSFWNKFRRRWRFRKD